MLENGFWKMDFGKWILENGFSFFWENGRSAIKFPKYLMFGKWIL